MPAILSDSTPPRRIAIKINPRRAEAGDVAAEFIGRISALGVNCFVDPDSLPDMRRRLPGVALHCWDDPEAADSDLLVVFGGDGTILRAAEWSVPRRVPLLGVNLGHVGFLAELEPSDVDDIVTKIAAGAHHIERRLVLQVDVTDETTGGVWSSFAVNEVSIEKAARERMLAVLASVDGRRVQRWHCDGVLVSTPTGSTAYAFSAGGPVVWPDVEAMLLLPLSAHALFAKPMVLSPSSVVELDLTLETDNIGVVWCDGCRTVDVGHTAHIQVRRHKEDLLIARLGEQPFSTRLVKKFDLPVEGWRGRDVGA